MNRRIHSLGIATAVAGLVLVGGTAASVPATHGRSARGAPVRPPASQFSAVINNQWFPLKPGTRYVYTGVKDGKPSRDVVSVTRRTKTIQGVPCVVVEDRLYVRGRLHERTSDWYSQDSRGNVWYFGERTAELDRRGKVTSTEGTWTSGVDGAVAGLFMPARPRVGQTGRQEFYKGHAEDHFKVIGLFRTVAPPGRRNALLIQETTPLEPGTVDHKLYVRGIGVVVEQTEKGGVERNELVAVTRVS
jgi:hypothetical protein